MATRVALKFTKECCMRRNKVKLNDNLRRYFCTADSAGAANTPPQIPKKVPHFSKKAIFYLCYFSFALQGRLFTGAAIGLLIGGGAYASTVDEATFCGWLFSATKLVNPFFAFLDPEVAHRLAVSAAARGWVPIEKRTDPQILELKVWGRRFTNPIGLSAGFDKNAEAVEGLLGLGFGFVEVGSVTPVPQEGNPKPRIFRLRNEGAIINRCGFNSEGIVAVAKRLGAQHGKRKLETSSSSSLTEEEAIHGGKAGPGILGVNLGKNKTSEDAAADYVQGVHTLSQFADYLVINISSPNTPGLRQLQGRKQLKDLVKKVQAARDEMQWGEEGPPPLLVKIAPDLSKQDLEDIGAVALALRVDGLIISNTTIQRPDAISQNPVAQETGGLSGKPLFNLSTNILKDMYILTKGRIPLIGCGGVSSGEDAYKKIRAGATLVQLYTAFAYGGPALIPQIKDELAKCLEKDGFKSIYEAVGADCR
ncbi:dihydroorotate dehydrogenase [Striga asiatica]|uniref:Dihydroorotate dehydrogenase (quinone), mitochondrial n=1 Tax=Striga asiatica TaxID=4170 RepID=A0A5A7QN41_STRAF|nr:dihydroorotate dehydrogenase [Striga asiatica]